MSTQRLDFKRIVAAYAAIVTISLPAVAQDPTDQELLQQLQTAEPEQTARITDRLIDQWSKSGSAAMDLLLRRGRDALEVQQPGLAIEHLTALTDHAPDFAEGWHTLALAYFHADMFGPAVDALEHTLALNPQHFGALQGLAAILEVTDQPALAYRVYREVEKITPHDPDVQEAIARLAPLIDGTAL